MAISIAVLAVAAIAWAAVMLALIGLIYILLLRRPPQPRVATVRHNSSARSN